MAIDWVCFDWGDTLADIRGTYEEMNRDQWFYNTLQHFGVKIPLQEFDAAYNDLSRDVSVTMRGNVTRWQKGFFFHEMCHKLNFPITTEESSRMADYYGGHFISKLKLLPGAHDLIEFLGRKKVRLALISNANGERVRQQLEFFKLNTYFSIILISDELGFDKSSNVPFERFLEHAKQIYPETKPENCIMVGDRADEDAYARNVGMKTIIVKRKHRLPSKDDLPFDFEVNDLNELKVLLDKLSS
ncbi:MAG: HAD family hydrolase [Candidatus Micrarchaeota archaeon]